MTVLVGGMRALGATQMAYGIFTKTPGVLNNHFFVNLFDMGTRWSKSNDDESVYNGTCQGGKGSGRQHQWT